MWCTLITDCQVKTRARSEFKRLHETSPCTALLSRLSRGITIDFCAVSLVCVLDVLCRRSTLIRHGRRRPAPVVAVEAAEVVAADQSLANAAENQNDARGPGRDRERNARSRSSATSTRTTLKRRRCQSVRLSVRPSVLVGLRNVSASTRNGVDIGLSR